MYICLHNHAVSKISGEDNPGMDIPGVISTGANSSDVISTGVDSSVVISTDVNSSRVNTSSGDTMGVNSSQDDPDPNCTRDLDSPHTGESLLSCTTPVGEDQQDMVENSCNTTELHQSDIVQESVVVEQPQNGIAQGFVGIEQPQSPIEQQLDSCDDRYATCLHPLGKVVQKTSALDQQKKTVEVCPPKGDKPKVGGPPQGNPPPSTLLLGNTYLYDLD